MSNLPYSSAVLHNDDNDDRNNTTNPKLSPINSRITSRSVLKRQQYTATRIANNQACDEIHDLQPKYSSVKKTTTTNNNETPLSKTSKSSSSHELMQGNYYERTRFITDHQSEPDQIDINVEDYKDRKKKHTPISTSENSQHKDRNSSPPFGDTRESIEQNVTQSVGRLLQSNRNSQESMKNSIESHEQTILQNSPNHHDDQQQRSLSRSSSSSSSTTTSNDSTDDSLTSNQRSNDKNKTTIPYQTLLNDDDEDELNEQPSKLIGESSTLLNKNLSQTYGTQTTTTTTTTATTINERSNYIPTNGYNSHGSSIRTTKSSSDNSGSIRTNSGSDNDEESDEEHYNNSTASNNPLSIYSQRNDLTNQNRNFVDSSYPYSNEKNSNQSKRNNSTRSEQTDNKEKPHQQVPRFKLPTDDSNENYDQFDAVTDHHRLPSNTNRSTQQSNTHQTNPSSLSSQQNRNYPDQQQQQQQTYTISRNHSRQYQNRPIKKRKQTQQQDIIRTELIPGHRGDLDVDELVMFIDGNSVPLRSNETNKSRDSSKTASLHDLNSNKTTSRKKSRKSTKSVSSYNENENSIDATNQSLIEQSNLSTEPDSNAIDNSPNKSTNQEISRSTWFEQTRDLFVDNEENPSLSIIPSANSEIVSEPFVTVTHRRRIAKERRQDNQPITRSSRAPPPPPPSVSSNSNEKRRIPSTAQNNTIRSTASNKSTTSPITKEEHDQNNNPVLSQSTPPLSSTTSVINPIIESTSEKPQTSPRLSSHSSSSSLSSLLKRQGKPPPVVFLDKSNDIELNDVSFGFDLDLTTSDQPSPDENKKPSTIEPVVDNLTDTLISPLNESTQSNEMSTEKLPRKQPQRPIRTSQFYSGSDIRHQQHRNYATQQTMPQSYVDLCLQYNQRLQLAYMNLLRAQYFPPQSPYVYVPTTYTTTTTTTRTPNEPESNEENNQTSTEQVQLVYATSTGQIYYPPSITKKSSGDSEPMITSIPTIYPTAYPPQYFYPSQVQQIIPSPSAYFQPIPSTPLVNERKDVDHEDDCENSTDSDHRKRQQSSADIMSNALQLVYSQQRRNAQTDRFNLDDLSAYLAMKWTDAVDHYMQGDSRILLTDEQ